MAKWLSGIVLVLAVVYGGYWFVGSTAVERAAQNGIEAAREAGWQIETAAPPRTRGFPSRFDTQVRDVSVTAPSGLRWDAPLMQVFALSYRPNEVIVVWPQRQTLEIDGQTLNIAAQDMRASGVVGVDGDLPLVRATWQADALRLGLGDSGRLIAQRTLLAVRQRPGTVQDYDLHLAVDAMAFGTVLIDRVRGDGRIQLSKPLDRSMLETPALIESIVLDDLSLKAGRAEATVSGTIEIGPDGTPRGALRLRAENWRDLMETAEEAGLIDMAQSENLLRLVSSLGGTHVGHSTLDLTFDVGGGYLSLAGFPLMALPALR